MEDNEAFGTTKVYTYNGGNIASVTEYGYSEEETPAGGSVYTYRYAGVTDKLSSITGLAGYTSSVSYDSAGNPLQWKGNVLQWSRGRRLTGYGSNSYTYDAGGIRQSKVVYNYDAFGNIASKTVSSFTLADTDPSGTTFAYGYVSGGVKGRIASYNGKSLTAYDSTPYYDGWDPSVYFDHAASSKYWQMTWQGHSLKSMQHRTVNSSSISETIDFRYDSNGVRTRKIVDGSKTDYIYVGDILRREKRPDCELTYMYGLDGFSGFEYKDNDGKVSRYHYIKNLQGDIVNILDNIGNIVVKYVYDSFGNHKVLNFDGTENNNTAFIGNINPIRYRGYYYDSEIGLYYLLDRFYDPEIGRFINPRSVEMSDLATINKTNLYAYNTSAVKEEQTISDLISAAIYASALYNTANIDYKYTGISYGIPDWVQTSVGAIPDIITSVRYLTARGIHTRFVYSTATRIYFPILGDTSKYYYKYDATYGKLSIASFKQIVAGNARAGFGMMVKSFGKTLGFSALVNFGFNLYANDWQIDGEMLLDTLIDTAISMGSYALAVGTASLITAWLAMLGFTVPGAAIVVGVFVLSICFEYLIRGITGYDK